MPTVMLVEDDPTMLSLLRTLLEMEGYQVVELTQGDQVLAHLREQKPDLVLLDVHLSELDGIEILKTIRQDQTLAGIRVLMSSGMDFEHTCLRAGADGFILKPYMPDELISRMRALLSEDG